MTPIIIIILLIVNIPLFKILFNLFFDDMDDFYESIRYSFTPDLFSLFKGEYLRDFGAEFKLGFFIFCCLIIIGIEYMFISIFL